jgi:hypothetical protein
MTKRYGPFKRKRHGLFNFPRAMAFTQLIQPVEIYLAIGAR